MKRQLPLLLVPVVVLGAAQAIAAPAPCSAANMAKGFPAQAGLPAPVEKMRHAIAKAASRCDFKRLEQLAVQGAPAFSFTFGSSAGGPARYWREAEKRDEQVLATLVKVLRLPHAKPGPADPDGIYVWPSAFGDQPTDRDWRALRPLYESDKAWEEAVSFMRGDTGYMGPRVGITRKGDWIFYVAGD